MTAPSPPLSDRPRRGFGGVLGGMSRATRPWLIAAMLALPLGSCGLHPLYDQGKKGVVAANLKGITVSPIPGPDGWYVHNALAQRLSDQGGGAPYRLEVVLDDQIESSAVRRDETVVRERRTLRARYRLIESASGTVVLDATAGADSGIDVVGSDYATKAAETTALERLSIIVAEQIVTRIAIYARQNPPAQSSQ